jgi:hypothetical protein
MDVHCNAVSHTEVIVDPFLASQNEPVGVHAELRTHVNQELSFINPVGDKKVACGCSTDMCRH